MTPPPSLAELPLTTQFFRLLLEAPPPLPEAEFPVSVQLLSALNSVPPAPRAELPLSVQ